jgi:hypothetical protein
MEEGTGIAQVIRVTKHPIVEIAEGVEVGGYTVDARMEGPADKYSRDFFLVKISKPLKFANLHHEKGSQMEHGEFSFNCGEELMVGDKLEVLIFASVPENSP